MFIGFFVQEAVVVYSVKDQNFLKPYIFIISNMKLLNFSLTLRETGADFFRETE